MRGTPGGRWYLRARVLSAELRRFIPTCMHRLSGGLWSPVARAASRVATQPRRRRARSRLRAGALVRRFHPWSAVVRAAAWVAERPGLPGGPRMPRPGPLEYLHPIRPGDPVTRGPRAMRLPLSPRAPLQTRLWCPLPEAVLRSSQGVCLRPQTRCRTSPERSHARARGSAFAFHPQPPPDRTRPALWGHPRPAHLRLYPHLASVVCGLLPLVHGL